jgi:uncharacterized protein (DUF58 family)
MAKLDHAAHSPATLHFGRVGGFLLIAVLAGLIHARALAALAVIAAVFVLGLVLPWLTLRAVAVCWHYPLRRGQVGKPLAVRLTLRSRLPWPAIGLLARAGWTDRENSEDEQLTVAVACLPARGTRELTATVVPTQRGVFPRAPATVATGFPFGLWQARRTESSGQVLIRPEIIPLPASGGGPGGHEHASVVRTGRSGQHGEFSGTRPYRVGEALRQIHWKQSARHDELIVWESRAVARGAVTLILETDPAIHSTSAEGSSLEKLLSVGASMAAALVGNGIRVTVTFALGRVFCPGNLHQFEEVLDALARFDPAQGADLETLRAGLRPVGARSPDRASGRMPWVVTTLGGWTRLHGRRVVVIDERPAGSQHSSPLPAGFPLVPLPDPGHHRLLDAWKEITRASEALV